jgi:hypothetical protein
MKIPYKAIHLEDAEIFSLDGIHKKYWKDFCDTCHTRIGFSPNRGDDSYDNWFLHFKAFRIIKAEFLKWDTVMNWAVKEDDLERFKMAFDFFCKLETQDKAALPMLLVLLRMQRSISDRFKDDIQIMEYLHPRACNITYEKYAITYLCDLPDDANFIKDLPSIEKKILNGLKKEREWDEDWQYYLQHAKDVRKKGNMTEVESVGSVTRNLADCIIDSYNRSLSDFTSRYSELNILNQYGHCDAIHAIIYRLFMSYMVSYSEVKNIFDEYPDNLGVKKLIETRSSLIKEFLQCELGQHWFNCILLDNGLELMGTFLINHQNSITEEEERRFLYLLDEICFITDILTGKEVKSCLNIEYCETEEIDQSLIIVNEGKQPESAVDVNTENKNVVVQNITVNGDVVLKKETNIGTNYGPNIEHNGGTLKLPKEK